MGTSLSFLSPFVPSSGTSSCSSYSLWLGPVWVSYHFSAFVLVSVFQALRVCVCVCKRETTEETDVERHRFMVRDRDRDRRTERLWQAVGTGKRPEPHATAGAFPQLACHSSRGQSWLPSALPIGSQAYSIRNRIWKRETNPPALVPSSPVGEASRHIFLSTQWFTVGSIDYPGPMFSPGSAGLACVCLGVGWSWGPWLVLFAPVQRAWVLPQPG